MLWWSPQFYQCSMNCDYSVNSIQFNSIQFISCSVDPKGVVNPQDIEHVNI